MCNVQGVGSKGLVGDSRFALRGSRVRVSFLQPFIYRAENKKNKKKFKNRCNGVTYVTEGVQSQ